jgi:chorismate mutase/prephenate dehydratase
MDFCLNAPEIIKTTQGRIIALQSALGKMMLAIIPTGSRHLLRRQCSIRIHGMEKERDETCGDPLAPLREQIDQLDHQIVAILNQRARIVVEIGKVKQTSNAPIYAPDREKIVLERVRRANREAGGPLPDSCIEAIYRELMSGSFALEKPLRIAFLGPKGSFSHLASTKKFGASVEHVPVADINGVFDEIAHHHADLGLVPIENSTIGGIVETMDAFVEHRSVTIVAEVLISIHHHLLAQCEASEIKVIYSKPEVLNQCRRWLAETLPEVPRVAVGSSSKAAEMAQSERYAAAIGSALAADLYSLKVLFANIEDNADNVTRFLVVGRQPAKRTGDDKTSIIFTTSHKSGALVDALDAFRHYGINLTNIATRPSRSGPFEYYFFVDFGGHHSDERVAKAIAQAKEHCLQMFMLGSFPRAVEIL